MKKILISVLVVALIVVSVPISSVSSLTYNNFVYTTSGTTATITGYNGGGAVSIPNAIAGYTVTEIADNAFKNCFNLTAISIPSTVQKIGKNAFEGDYNLTSVTMSTVVETIGDGAFASCSRITEITLPASLISLGKDVFLGCTALKKITVDPHNTQYSDDNGVLYNIAQTELIKYPEGKQDVSYSLKSTTLSIGENAFRNNKSLEKVIFNEGLETVGKYAFCNATALSSATFSSTVKNILDFVFSGCSKLVLSDLGDSLESVAAYAFENCSKITEINLPSTITAIDKDSFSKCTAITEFTVEEGGEFFSSQDGILYNADKTILIKYPEKKADTEFVFPDTVKNIENGAFKNVVFLERITFDAKLEEIAANTFEGCTGIKQIIFKEGISKIGSFAFQNCSSLESISIPNSVESLGTAAFKGCTSLTLVEIGDGISEISEYLFENCSALETVLLSIGVNTVSISAFNGCTNLKAINVEDENSYFKSVDGILFNKTLDTIVKYPANKEGTSYTIPNTVTTVAKYAFQSNLNLESVSFNNVTSFKEFSFTGAQKLNSIVFSNNVTEIGNGVFKDCISLTDATLTDSVKTVSPSIFYNCTKLSNVTIPSGVTLVGSAAFEKCTGLKEITLPDTILTINDNAFLDSGLTSIDIPEGTNKIGATAFTGSKALRTVNISSTVKTLSTDAFYECTALENIFVDDANTVCEDINGVLYNKACTILIQYPLGNARGKYKIPEGTTMVYNNSFAHSKNLLAVEIPDTVTSVNAGAFKGSARLVKVKIPATVTTVGYGAFEECSEKITLHGEDPSAAKTFADTYKINFSTGPFISDICDLYISDVRADSSVLTDGDTIGFYVVLRNIGENPCIDNIGIDLYIDNIYRETLVFEDAIDIGAIKIVPLNTRWTSYFGAHTVKAVLSSDNEILQSDKTNDGLKTRITVADI